MKRIIYIVLFLSLGFTGCEKYLDQAPDQRSELTSPEKVSQLLVSAYPQNAYMVFTESISDNSDDKGAGEIGVENHDPYFFQDLQTQSDDTPDDYWRACYKAIAATNVALEAIEKAPDPQRYTAQRGEALLARAYSHFMLVSLFAKTYDETTASSDLGIPYVTEPETEVIKQYDRSTVANVYKKIEEDLKAGLPLLQNQYKSPKYHFTTAAAHAFAARFYLFKKDYQKVIDHANAAFPGTTIQNNLRPVNSTYRQMNDAEARAQLNNQASLSANLLLAEQFSLYGYYNIYARYRYGPSNDILYSTVYAANASGAPWAWSSMVVQYSANDPFLAKYGTRMKLASLNANYGDPYCITPLLTTDELLFNRAEASVMTGNFAAAITDLNMFLSQNIEGYIAGGDDLTEEKVKEFYETDDTKEALIKTILDFKRTAFLHEGMRWFDILRHKLTVVHRTVDGQEMILGPDDPRRVFQLPVEVQSAGLVLNPR
ncbi:SusD-like starch-binding protein associating with outer membrane [Arcticibacter tournemirensis]|uniref:RagB/SusD family nutrient uptake outer membrane protein n=1 Tax=Arcticibacter tournemirensis TaxID=699437 RepID=A0A5M9HCA2_9SPHI|nr:RagB/SusD family nutrient uptake outer membrane protein [Arcticibacter tournemirensis]KAA8484350.1 RagB/SusD family nutrient uptake outer membrane protein [Arcticibacter tournemirensis]TQM49786.1 SusD-like starch-binding protein associating with outer membrane [Arcticibacter tournemirensis]